MEKCIISRKLGRSIINRTAMGSTCFGEYAVLIAVTYNSHAAPTDGSEAEATTTHAVNDAGLDSSRDCGTVLSITIFHYVLCRYICNYIVCIFILYPIASYYWKLTSCNLNVFQWSDADVEVYKEFTCLFVHQLVNVSNFSTLWHIYLTN